MSRNVAGIDISDRSIEAVSFRAKGNGIIENVARIDLPAGVVSRGEIQDYPALLERVRWLFDTLFGKRRGTVEVGAALPETAVYTKVFRFPAGLSLDHYRKALEIGVAEEFPFDVTADMCLNFVIVGADENAKDFLCGLTEMRLVNEYERLLREAGAEPQFLEPESSALARAVLPPEESADALIADIGARTTMLVAFGSRGEPVLSVAVPVGGDILTEAIEARMKVTLEEAEKMKQAAGFDAGIDDGRVMMIIQQPFESIANEIKTTVDYYKKKTGRDIGRIVLAGGTSLMPGIEDYVVSKLSGLKVEAANPLKRFSVSSKAQLPPRFKKEAVLYSTAIGLAMRVSGMRDRPGPNLLPAACRQMREPPGLIQSILSIFRKPPRANMTPTKKSQPKKPSARKKSESPPKKTVVKSEDAAMDTAAVAAMPDAPSSGVSVKKTEALADLNKIVASEDATLIDEPAVSERDFGMGVGDILGETQASSVETERGVGERGSGKLSIESILQGKSAEKTDFGDDDSGNGEDEVIEAPTAPKRRLRWSVFIPLVVFILAILLVAEGAGLFGGAGREGTSKFLSFASSLFGGGEEAIVPSDENTPAEVQPVIPEVITLSVLISAGGEEEGLAVPVVASRSIETEVTASDSFPASGQAQSAEARAVGTITVVNETSNPYRFVATTRFLSTDGVLFRLKEASDIPVNGTVDVEVYADEVGAKGDIGPSKFTIPGLPTDVQQYVYGRSRVAMTGGSGTVTAVSDEDIDAARKDLYGRLTDEARDNFKSMITADELVLDDLITSSELSAEYPEVNAVGATFEAKAVMLFSTLVVPETEVLTMLQQKMVESLPEGVNPSDYTLGSPLHTVEAYDTTSGRAEIRIEAPVSKL